MEIKSVTILERRGGGGLKNPYSLCCLFRADKLCSARYSNGSACWMESIPMESFKIDVLF